MNAFNMSGLKVPEMPEYLYITFTAGRSCWNSFRTGGKPVKYFKSRFCMRGLLPTPCELSSMLL